MAIGDVLIQPESGWKRWDNNDSRLVYTGSWEHVTGLTNTYQGTRSRSTVSGDKITFTFVGSKMRVIGLQTSNYSANVEIEIDGTKETYSQLNAISQYYTVLYESADLDFKEHVVTITKKDSSWSDLDAIDIKLASQKMLLSSGNNMYRTSTSFVDSSVNFVPKLTSSSDQVTGIITSASSQNTNTQAYSAFSDGTWQVSSGTTGWLRIKFPNPVNIGSFSMMGWTNTQQNTTKITFRGSNDGVTWEVIDTFTVIKWTSNVRTSFSTMNKKSYNYYEFSDLVSTSTLTMSKIELYERNDIHILTKISTAIVDKSTFINFGADEIDFSSPLIKIRDVINQVAPLGKGKVYEHNIDLSKIEKKKIILGEM